MLHVCIIYRKNYATFTDFEKITCAITVLVCAIEGVVQYPVIILAYRLWSRDSSVRITLGYELGDRGSRVRFPEGAGNFSLHHRVQNGYGAQPASYLMGTRGSFPGGKAAGA
jgi:hypothetical protein